MTLKIKSTSSKNTEQLGEQVGKNLKGGESIELKSDLGGGKTTFVRGLARGMGSSDHVASPSFTIVREYHTKSARGLSSSTSSKDGRLMHFDFHRLNDAGLLKHELAELINEPKNVVVVEWADLVKNVLPKKRLTIELKPLSENVRQVNFRFPDQLAYTVKGLA